MLDTAYTTEPRKIQSESIQQDINKVLEQLPLESLKMLQQFAAFLQQQISEKPAPKNGKRPLEIKTVPVSQVMKLAGALPTGYEGDSLIDSEAYFDDI